MKDEDVEQRVNEFFQLNYKRLLAEGGAHILTPRALEQAREQVLHYWRKLRDVAVNVTETEVRLQLPNRTTPKGRKFVIEGVVDLVREQGRIRMYDIKTHYCGEVTAQLGKPDSSYAGQLNLYAYIWRELRGQELHEMGIIAVQLPEALRDAIRDGDVERVKAELTAWNPLVSVPFSPSSLKKVFERIAETVDNIEDGKFAPPPSTRLKETGAMERGRAVPFATMHCRNCDGRFSCDSYREYMLSGGAKGRKFDVQKYLEAAIDDGEIDEWVDGNIELDLDRLFPEALEAAPPGKSPATVAPRRRR